MDRTEAPALARKPPANGYSPTLPPPRHVSTPPIVPTGQEECLPIPRSVIESSERTTALVGEKLSRKSR